MIDKTILVLAASVGGATAGQLAARTGLPRATVYRLATALELHRLLVRDASGRWQPGSRLRELAEAAPDVLVAAAEPLLAALSAATGEFAQLFLRRADECLCVAAATPEARRADLRPGLVPVGSACAITAGSSAHVLLAWEPPAAVLQVLPRCRFTDRTLAEVRRRGWAQSVAERHPGVASVSAPVRDRNGRVIASVSVSGPIQRMGWRPGERHASAVLRVSQRLSGL